MGVSGVQVIRCGSMGEGRQQKRGVCEATQNSEKVESNTRLQIDKVQIYLLPTILYANYNQ